MTKLHAYNAIRANYLAGLLGKPQAVAQLQDCAAWIELLGLVPNTPEAVQAANEVIEEAWDVPDF